ncbi:MAG TPA: RDD family protein [Mycobacterium sp.]|nr:RDD family protein [Mycobacterium sp.]
MPQVVTGDAVVLDVQVAQLPVRAVSALIDLAAMVMITIVGLVLVGLTVTQLDNAAVQAFLIVFVVLVPVLYPTIFETATRGRSLGKMAMGLRVVSDDGGPERFSQALFRALASVVEIWMLFGSPAVICSMVSPRGKRIGDVFAGTVVISERGPRMAPPPVMPPALAWWAPSLQLAGLTPELADVARQFLGRAPQLEPGLRNQMAYRIATDVAARIAPPPPPGAPPELMLAAVLAERHRRELVRLQPPSGWPAGPPAPFRPAPPPVPPSDPTVTGPAASPPPFFPPAPPNGDGLVPPG